jgi:hypothetical protein
MSVWRTPSKAPFSSLGGASLGNTLLGGEPKA